MKALAPLAIVLLIGQAQAKPPERGINLSGAEYNPARLPGRVGTEYVYPDAATINAFVDRGLRTIRLPVRWERVQPRLNGALSADELGRIDAVMKHVARRGGTLILDLHNYGRYADGIVGSDEVPDAAFADVWRRLAAHYADNPAVWFGLMNEPHDMPIAQWFRAAQAAVVAIRETGATNMILVPGASWTGAHSWFSEHDGWRNATGFDTISDPADAMLVEVHQYFDRNYSGTGKACVSASIGVEKIAPVTAWLRAKGRRGFLGEFGASTQDLCLQAISATIAHLEANDDVWAGWTYWAGGAWLGNYPYAATVRDGAETPQLKLLERPSR